RARLEQLLRLLEVPLGGVQRGARAHEIGLGARPVTLLRGRLEAGKELAGGDLLPLANEHGVEVALDARTHVDDLDGAQVAGDGHRRLDVAALRGRDVAAGEHDGARAASARSAPRSASA